MEIECRLRDVRKLMLTALWHSLVSSRRASIGVAGNSLLQRLQRAYTNPHQAVQLKLQESYRSRMLGENGHLREHKAQRPATGIILNPCKRFQNSGIQY